MKNFKPGKQFWFIAIGILLVATIGSTIVAYKLQFTGEDRSEEPVTYRLQSTPTQSAVFTPTVITTPSPTPTPLPTPSKEWRVVENSDEVKIGRYYYAVITFENLTTRERKKGQCQQPAWQKPEVGHIYLLTNTYADYWLFIPVEGVEDQIFQRFAPYP